MLALDGLRVVELGGGVAAGYCGALFRACGAEVLKVEVPGKGDMVRALPPFSEHARFPESSGLYAFLNAGKLSSTIDVTESSGSRLVLDIVVSSDVVVEAMGPGNADAVGLDYPSLKQVNHGLIMASLSWFGRTGHRRNWQGTDAIAQAIGPPEGPPIIPGGYQAQINGGLTAFLATMAALVGRLEGDEGVLIDQSITEAQVAYYEPGVSKSEYDEETSIERIGPNRFQPTYPQTIYPTSDGWIGITALTPAQWCSCCELVGAVRLYDDPRFSNSLLRCENADELDAELMPLFLRKSASFWFHEGQARRVPFALVPTMKELATLDHFVARDVMSQFSHTEIGTFSAPGIPWKFSETKLQKGGRSPTLGQHTQEVLEERLNLSRSEIDKLVEDKAVWLPRVAQ
jgi:crotonobetainyl-CoA:carnitine CoA-transferase CaiB-like acyl-CoA transferase